MSEPGTTPVGTLILCDGSLGGLVACASVREQMLLDGASVEHVRAGLGLLPFGWSGEVRALQERATRAIASVYDVRVLESAPAVLDVREGASEGERECAGLLGVLMIASRLGATRVVWPAHAGHATAVDIDRLEAIVDRALSAARLAALALPPSGALTPSMQTPFADLSDVQLADLAYDLDVPIQACWWWGDPLVKGDHPAPVMRERARWWAALDDMGWRPVIALER